MSRIMRFNCTRMIMVRVTQFQNVKIPSTVHNIMYSKFKETVVKKFK